MVCARLSGEPGSAAVHAAPGFDAFPHSGSGNPNADHRVEPPAGRPAASDRQADQHGGGLGGAQIVLGALSGGGRRAQPGGEPVFAVAQQWHQYQRESGQHDPDQRGPGSVLAAGADAVLSDGAVRVGCPPANSEGIAR